MSAKRSGGARAQQRAKTQRKPLPPMWPRVDVAAELSKPGGLAAVAERLSELDLRRFLEPLLDQLRRERGALLRGGKSLPPIVRKAAELADGLFDAVRDALAMATFVVAMREKKKIVEIAQSVITAAEMFK